MITGTKAELIQHWLDRAKQIRELAAYRKQYRKKGEARMLIEQATSIEACAADLKDWQEVLHRGEYRKVKGAKRDTARTKK